MRGLFLFIVSGLAHYLAARWLLSTLSPAAREKRRLVVFGAATLLSVLPSVTRAAAATHGGLAMRALVAVMMLEFGAVLLALVPIGIMTAVARLVASLGGMRRTPAPEPAPSPDRLVTRRQAIERVAGGAILGATTAALGWGMVRGRHAFAIEEVVVRIKGWPRALEGYTIAQISDVHAGAFVGERELDEGFALVARIRADLLVATGDLVDFDAASIPPLAARLAGAGARDGACAVLGNHDHYAGAAEVAAGLRDAGVRVLSNESVHLRARDGGGFALLGVDDLHGRSGRTPGFCGPDLTAAARGLGPDVPRILLAHQPRYLHECAGRVALQLSGHTHGGQINPGFCPADLVMEFVAGRYEREGSTLWVNRGFGVAGPPSRLGAPPEITKIVVVGA